VEGLVKAHERVRLTIDEIAIGSKICIIFLYLIGCQSGPVF
jgi:hypothetical protein